VWGPLGALVRPHQKQLASNMVQRSSKSLMAPGSKPHLVAVLQDDIGYADAGIMHGGDSAVGLKIAPHLNELAQKGIRLRHYTHYHCSPSRRSFLTGRSPLHHSEELDGIRSDRINLEWTGLAKKLGQAGYACHWYGKGHTGYKSMNHMPPRMGFTAGSAYILQGLMPYFCGDNDPDKKICDQRFEGETGVKNGEYSSKYFADKAVAAINAHDPEVPLFVYLPWQSVHEPYDVPPEEVTECRYVDTKGECHKTAPTQPETQCHYSWGGNRAFKNGTLEVAKRDEMPEGGCVYMAMLRYTDQRMQDVTDAIRSKGMWSNTLLLYTSDNGAAVSAGNNWPLRGRKDSNFEGGSRVLAFLSGGFVPESQRGSRNHVALHIMDWYPTFCVLAGVDPSDDHANLPGVDGVDVSRFLADPDKYHHGSAHEELWLSKGSILINGTMKYIKEQPGTGNLLERGNSLEPGTRHFMDEKIGWTEGLDNYSMVKADHYLRRLFKKSAPTLFTKSAATHTEDLRTQCMCCEAENQNQNGGCVFNVVDDMSETIDLGIDSPTLLKYMQHRLEEANKGLYDSEDKSPPELMGACSDSCAKKHWGKLDGPVCGVPGCDGKGDGKNHQKDEKHRRSGKWYSSGEGKKLPSSSSTGQGHTAERRSAHQRPDANVNKGKAKGKWEKDPAQHSLAA